MLVKLCYMRKNRRSTRGPFCASIILANNYLPRVSRKNMIIRSCLKFLASKGKPQCFLSVPPPPTCCLLNPMMNLKTQQAHIYTSQIYLALLLSKLIPKLVCCLQLLLRPRPSLVLLRRTTQVLGILRTSSSSHAFSFLFDTC